MAGLNIAQIMDRARALGMNISEQEADSILSQAWDQSQWGADSGMVDQLLSSGGYLSPEDQMLNEVNSVLDKAIFGPQEKAAKYLEENPFNFDEELARASAEERFDPYYDAELGDYMEGIEKTRQRSTQDETRIQRELTTDAEILSGKNKRNLEESLLASREGYSGTGLFFSGKRLREEGLTRIGAGETEEGIRTNLQRGVDSSQLRQQRTMEDTGLQERSYRRRLGAERTTAIESDIASQKQEEYDRRNTELQSILGYSPIYGTLS